MNLFKKSVLATAVLALAACSGDDGATGPQGTTGPAGVDGSAGLSSLIATATLSEGDTNCPGGGTQIDSGIDTDGNGELASGEITSTEFLCLPFTPPVAFDIQANTEENAWYKAGDAEVEAAGARSYTETRGQAKNVILFVGDGMGVSTVTAARILEGQLKGMMGEENVLSFGEFPFSGLAKTYNVDAQTPDSAGTMTAMMSGVKTDVGTIGVDEDIVRGDCSTVAGNEMIGALELAEIAGKATGVVSTARITHATPAATYAKSADRNWEDVSDKPASAADCDDIALQLVEFEANLEARYPGLDVDGLEVAMGGGRRHFLPNDVSFNVERDVADGAEGDRTDARDLTAEWLATYADGVYVNTLAEFSAVDGDNTPHLFGLFNESHMRYEADRYNDVGGEPSLRDMTEKAIQVLDNDDDGFFLMVESGRIDHGHHAGSAYSALTDTIEFAEAVAKAVELTDAEETLIIVKCGFKFASDGF